MPMEGPSSLAISNNLSNLSIIYRKPLHMSRNLTTELIAFGWQLCDLFLQERGVKSSVLQRDVSRDTY